MEAEGKHLRAEFYRPEGPRGRRGSAPIDLEIENRLREKLSALVPSTFAGEESGTTLCDAATEYVWLVDPQDGTFDFTMPKRPIRRKITGLSALTTARGGAYFFLPGIRALHYLARRPG